MKKKIEALTEFSRFSLYQEFVRSLISREMRKVRHGHATRTTWE